MQTFKHLPLLLIALLLNLNGCFVDSVLSEDQPQPADSEPLVYQTTVPTEAGVDAQYYLVFKADTLLVAPAVLFEKGASDPVTKSDQTVIAVRTSPRPPAPCKPGACPILEKILLTYANDELVAIGIPTADTKTVYAVIQNPQGLKQLFAGGEEVTASLVAPPVNLANL